VKIVFRDENTLILRPQSQIFLVISAVLFALGVWVLVGAFHTETLACAHTPQARVTCTIRRTTFGVTLHETRVTDVQGARATETASPTAPSQVALLTGGGEWPLPIFTNLDKPGCEQLAQEINAFIQTRQAPPFERSAGGTGFEFSALCPLSMAALLLVVGLQNHNTTWTFNRQTGQLHYRSETLLGIRTRLYALQDIADVKLVRQRRALCVTIFMRDGQQLFIDGSSINVESLKAMTATLRQFLGLSKNAPLW